MGIIDKANSLAGSQDPEYISRKLRRETEKKLRKEGATQEKIDYCMKQMDDAKQVNEIFSEALKKMRKLGYNLHGCINYHKFGATTGMEILPIQFEQYEMINSQKVIVK